MSPKTVVVTDHDFADLSIEREILEGVADVVELEDEIGGDGRTEDAEAVLSRADAVLNLRMGLDADRIAAMNNCRIIARYGIGVDNVDLTAATERGIPVTNVPEYCLEEVATHAVSLMLALSRGVVAYDASVAEGEWNRDFAAPIHRFSTRTVGIVGYGAIGREVGQRVAAFGADAIASDPYVSAADVADEPAEMTSFEDVLDRADVVTVHSPLTESTREMFDREAFDRMKEDAYFVNVARGPIVDDDAIREALDTGQIRGAGLDVFPEEPPDSDDPLRNHEAVVTTPHVAWYSKEANAERRRTAAEIVRDVLTGGEPRNVVTE